jgi:hypothetical protein
MTPQESAPTPDEVPQPSGRRRLSSTARPGRFSALYFSIITLTTTGYGDITPVASVARMLAMMEAITGTFYVAVLISRLVALYSVSTSTAESNQDNTPSQPIL